MNETTILIISLILSLIAIIVSVIALVKTNKHNQISVKPILHWRYYSSTRRGRGIYYIENNGLGPLTFKNFDMIYDGTYYKAMFKIKHVLNKKFDFVENDYDKSKNSNTLTLNDFVMKAGERKNLIGFQLKRDARKKYKDFVKEIKNIEFRYTYEDMYGNESNGKFKFSSLSS